MSVKREHDRKKLFSTLFNHPVTIERKLTLSEVAQLAEDLAANLHPLCQHPLVP